MSAHFDQISISIIIEDCSTSYLDVLYNLQIEWFSAYKACFGRSSIYRGLNEVALEVFVVILMHLLHRG